MENQTHYDGDIIIHINSVFSVLTQLGVGDPNGFWIEDDEMLWEDFLGDTKLLELVKSYMYQRVKQMFDPPTSSIVKECQDKNIAELEWRINVIADKSEVR